MHENIYMQKVPILLYRKGQRGVPMNPFFKFILRIISNLNINMQEDYVWVRKLQAFISKKPMQKFRYLDRKIYALTDQHEIPIRVFFPNTAPNKKVSMIYIHGGGWTIGDIDSYSGVCQNIADELNLIVYSIDYRLAPEYQYPIGFDDCLQAVTVLMGQEKLAEDQQWILMGDSAGGNLAAAVSLKLKQVNRPLPDKQILLYPVTYWDHTPASPFASIVTEGYDYGLTIKKMQEYMENYVPIAEQRKDPFVAPLLAEDLNKQPDTLIITAEHDPLRDEGEAYGEALREAGNSVTIHRILDSIHGFISYPAFAEPVKEAFQVIHEFLEN